VSTTAATHGPGTARTICRIAVACPAWPGGGDLVRAAALPGGQRPDPAAALQPGQRAVQGARLHAAADDGTLARLHAELRAQVRAAAALKVFYLAVRNPEEFRSPNTGIRSSGWKQALQAFTIYFDGRIPTP
jgi:hypothetical protein